MLARRGAGARQQRGASSKAKSGSGPGVWEAVGTGGSQGAPARTPLTHSLTHSGLRGGGQAADRGAASSSRMVLGAGQRSLSLPFPGAAGPGPMFVLFSSLRAGG